VASSSAVGLIVNADDFGYCLPVSRGIIKAIQAGAVTATGILANAPRFTEQMQLLFESAPDVDLGVHLNLTFGQPVSTRFTRHLGAGSGGFPGRNALLARLATRRIAVTAVEAEWRSQIERCLEAGVLPRFLNSHEHVHMAPSLFALTRRLAEAYRIPQVRRVTADGLSLQSLSSLVRVSAMSLLAAINRRKKDPTEPRLLGLAQSGKLNTGYYRRQFPALKPGRNYELMCHPGYYDPAEMPDPKLRRYHAWEAELDSLLDPSFQELCARYHIRLIGYRHLERTSGAREGAA
jgi:predicted glycoside hydrolase/deacetylase ChbG (UPF0249 family)